jgi:hypothetical protein
LGTRARGTISRSSCCAPYREASSSGSKTTCSSRPLPPVPDPHQTAALEVEHESEVRDGVHRGRPGSPVDLELVPAAGGIARPGGAASFHPAVAAAVQASGQLGRGEGVPRGQRQPRRVHVAREVPQPALEAGRDLDVEVEQGPRRPPPPR